MTAAVAGSFIRRVDSYFATYIACGGLCAGW